MSDFEPNAGQKVAVDQILTWAKEGAERPMSLTGAAGTGKTALLRHLIPKLASSFNGGVVCCAMTGKAALRMRELLGVTAVTFHSAFFVPPNPDNPVAEFTQARLPPRGALLIIDEASMMPPALYDQLNAAWCAKGVSVLFVGDPFQVPPVMSKKEAEVYGEDAFSVFRTATGPMLTQVMRSGDDVLYAATYLRENGRLLNQSRGNYQFRQVSSVITDVIDAYMRDDNDHALITWRNALRMAVSAGIRSRKGYASEMPKYGEPVLICKNGQQHLNGQVISAGEFRPGPFLGCVKTLFMKLDDPIEYIDYQGNMREIVELLIYDNMSGQTQYVENRDAWKVYAQERKKRHLPEPMPITWGYALTAHRAQGSEYRSSTVFLTKSDFFNPAFKKLTVIPGGREIPFGVRLLYTGLTRAKEFASMVIGDE